MPRLFIVIGRATRTAAPQVIYCGDDGAAALSARDTSPLPLVEFFRNPRGIRKQVPGAAANAAAEEAAAAAEVEAEQQAYNAAVLAKAGELAAERDAKIRELTETLLRVEKQSIDFQARADRAEAELAQLRADVEGAQRGHLAALAERDAEVTSLRAALKAAKKKAGEAPPPEPAAP